MRTRTCWKFSELPLGQTCQPESLHWPPLYLAKRPTMYAAQPPCNPSPQPERAAWKRTYAGATWPRSTDTSTPAWRPADAPQCLPQTGLDSGNYGDRPQGRPLPRSPARWPLVPRAGPAQVEPPPLALAEPAGARLPPGEEYRVVVNCPPLLFKLKKR